MKPIKNHKAKLLFLVALLTVLAGAFYLQKKVLPQQIRAVQTNLNVPVRYAFIQDGDSAKLTIFDLYELTVIGEVPLLVKADSLGISRLGGYIAYAKHGSHKIHLLDLEDLTQETITVSRPVHDLSVHYGGNWLSYVTSDAVIITNPSGKWQGKVSTKGAVSTTYSPDGRLLFIAELDSGRISQYELLTNEVTTLLEVKAAISPISIRPDQRALFFTGKDSRQTTGLYHYDLVSETLGFTELAVSVSRPYVTSDSRSILAIGSDNAKNNFLFQIAATNLAVEQRYEVGVLALSNKTQSLIYTGWLDQTAVVMGSEGLYSFTLGDKNSGQYHPVGNQPLAALVSSDSKTLLMAVNDSANLWLFDMRQQALDKPIPLTIYPRQVLMGETNTLCH